MRTNERDDHYRVSALLLDTGAGMAEEHGSTSSTDGDTVCKRLVLPGR